MQSADLNNHLATSKMETDNMSSRNVLQPLPLSLTSQTSITTHAQGTISPSTFTNSTVRTEKPSNVSNVSQNSRFVPTNSITMTPYHIPKGTAAVANISMPKGKVSGPIVRTTPIPQVQPVTTVPGSSSSTLIPTLTRPVTTWVVTNTTSPALLQKSTALNVVSSTYVRPPNAMTVTSRITAPIVTKPSETSVKPIIIHNASKQLITQASNQLSERNTGGILKTNVGVVTIRGSITPTQQPQTRVSVPAPSTQSSRVTMLLPTAAGIRKPQALAPKVITQTSRAPFTVQSIPVSVSHTPSALTMNKKTASITIGSNQASISVQNTSPVVRANPAVVASNSLIAINDIRSTQSSANVLIQTVAKTQSPVPTHSSATAFSAPAKTYMYDSENFQVKRTLVSSSTTAFTSAITSVPTTAISKHFNVLSAVNTSQIPKLNPIMVLEAPRVTAAVTSSTPAPVQSPALSMQSYVIPQGTSLGPVQQPPPSLPQQQPQQQLHRVSPVPQQPSTNLKQNASPRPSILRKRDVDGSITKAQRNLTPLLNTVSITSTTVPSPPPSPHLPDAGGGQSSNSSSTMSATSSPGIPTIDPESPPSKAEKLPVIIAPLCDEEQLRTASSLVEMSPRKKPRKQQLTVSSTNEPKLEDEMEFISDDKIKKESKETADTTISVVQERSKSSPSSSSSKKRNISILSGYNHAWKSRHHHFLRYSDLKYKEDKRPTVSDIANQKYVTQKINGWKIYHLSAQMEDLHDIEIEVVDKLSTLLKLFSSHEEEGSGSKIVTNELIMGNMQRSKVVSDSLKDAKSQMMKVFNHKKHVSDIINKYASKRTIKKKGRY